MYVQEVNIHYHWEFRVYFIHTQDWWLSLRSSSKRSILARLEGGDPSGARCRVRAWVRYTWYRRDRHGAVNLRNSDARFLEKELVMTSCLLVRYIKQPSRGSEGSRHLAPACTAPTARVASRTKSSLASHLWSSLSICGYFYLFRTKYIFDDWTLNTQQC